MKKKVHIMDSIDILDRITITIFEFQPGHFSVDVLAKEEGKQCVFDEKAKLQLEATLFEKTKGMDAKQPNLRGYLEEYTGRYIQALHKHDLFIIEDIPDAPDDHYAEMRRKFANYRD